MQPVRFIHYWGRSRQGNWVVKRKTASSRLSRAVRSIAHWCRLHRHQPLGEQQHTLGQKLRGHYAYYGITGNIRQLLKYAFQTERTWRKWLERRTRSAPLPWEQFRALLARHPLPRPRIVHRYVAVSQTLL